MSPFETWYTANVEPILRAQLANLPKPTHEPIRKASREQMAACWNAAIETAIKRANIATDPGDGLGPGWELGEITCDDLQKLKVTP